MVSSFLISLFLASCSLLPKGEDKIKSPWKSFAQAMESFNQIELHKTTQDDLRKLGFDPYSIPNVHILSYLDIIQKFVPNNSVKLKDLPPSVRKCLAGRESCIAYEALPGISKRKRVGSLFMDLLKFKRKTIKTGWKFNALIVLDHGVVVYKIWSGQPMIDQEGLEKRPLGPLQSSTADIAIDSTGF